MLIGQRALARILGATVFTNARPRARVIKSFDFKLDLIVLGKNDISEFNVTWTLGNITARYLNRGRLLWAIVILALHAQ